MNEVFSNYLKLLTILISILGCTQSNNDVHVFFENDEIEQLEKGTVKGTYFNLKDPSKTCPLEASVENEIKKIATSGEKDKEGIFMTKFYIKISPREYQTLKEKRTAGTHDGFRHIELLDASNPDNLGFGFGYAFRQLKHYESKHS